MGQGFPPSLPCVVPEPSLAILSQDCYGRMVCRMHGGRAGAPKGEANGNYRHGRHTKEVRAQRSRLRSERIRLAALLRAFDASDGSEADLADKMKAVGLL